MIGEQSQGYYQKSDATEPYWVKGDSMPTLSERTPFRDDSSHVPRPKHGATGQTPRAGSGGSSAAGGAGQTIQSSRQTLRPSDVSRGWFLSFFSCINVLTIFSAASVFVAEILSIVFHELSPVSIGLRVYGAAFCVGVVLAELSITQAVRDTLLLQNWITRGLFYSFVGLLAIEQQQEKGQRQDPVNLYILSAGLSLVGLGLLYALMGLCCCKRLRDERLAKYYSLRSHAELEEALRHQTSISI